MSLKDFFGFKKKEINIEEKQIIESETIPEIIEVVKFDYSISFGDFCIIEDSTNFGTISTKVNLINNKEENIPSPLFISIKYNYLKDLMIIKFYTKYEKENEEEEMYKLLCDENVFIKKNVADSYDVFNIVEQENPCEWNFNHCIEDIYKLREYLKDLVINGNYDEEIRCNLKNKYKHEKGLY